MAPGTEAYSVSIKGKCGSSVIFDRLMRINLSLELGVIAQSCADGVKAGYTVLKIQTSKEESGPYKDVDADETANILSDFGFRFLICTFGKVDDEPVHIPSVNAFSKIMSTPQGNQGRAVLKRKTTSSGVVGGISGVDQIYNKVLTLFEERGLYFCTENEGTYVVQTLTRALWCITNHHSTLARKKSLPCLWQGFENFNDLKKKKHRKQCLCSSDLTRHGDELYALQGRPSISGSKWKDVRCAVRELGECLIEYAEYLRIQAEEQNKRQKLNHCVTQLSDAASVAFRVKVSHVDDQYRQIDEVVAAQPFGESVLFDEHLHLLKPFTNRMQRMRFFEDLHLSVDVDMLKYCPGGSHVAVYVICKVPADRPYSQAPTDAAKLLAANQMHLPQYHTHAMKQQFRKRYSGIVKQPHVLRSLYSELSMDASVDQNPEMDARMHMALEGEVGIVVDLRTENKGRPGNKFDTFFEHLETEIEQVLAADDRRHNVAHLSQWISLPDLVKQVTRKCPPNTDIPSKSLVRLQFQPRNKNSHTAATYTKKYAVQYKIQRRQLRETHPDVHYCAAIFKYLRSMAVKLEASCKLLCVDDKSKVNFGEPGTAMASGVRGKQQLGTSASTISAADHDVHNKGHLTPSVILDVEIPDSVDKSFCRGEVVVHLNDSIFQASTPFRHAVSIRKHVMQQDIKPEVLLLFSDGGPDHRLTYESVKMSLICLFRALDLDMLVTARCAPGHSWINPVERIMSILNLALQNVALERDTCTEELEGIIKKCTGMAAIRKAAEKHPDLKPAWIHSLVDMVSMLRTRFERLALKEKPIVTRDPVSDDEVEGLQSFGLQIDPAINMTQLQQRFVSRLADYQNFVERHCRARNYTFQIKKCDDAKCCSAKKLPAEDLAWLPDPVPDSTGEHYKSYEVLLAQETTQEHMPSNKNFVGKVSEDAQGCKTSELTAQHARKIIKCGECGKPRVIYSSLKPSSKDLIDLDACIEDCEYTCGSMLVPIGHRLYKKMFVRLALNCADPIEYPYYSSGNFLFGVCCFCVAETTGGPRRAALREKYRVVLPVCNKCLDDGKDFPKSRPFKR